jgi:hypothetical protein
MDDASNRESPTNAAWMGPLIGLSVLLAVIVVANWIAIPIVGYQSALMATGGAMAMTVMFAAAVTSGGH